MPTTLERSTFATPIGGTIRVKYDNPTGIAVGASQVITKPDGTTLTGTVQQILPYGSAMLSVIACSKPSGMLILPKGSAVA